MYEDVHQVSFQMTNQISGLCEKNTYNNFVTSLMTLQNENGIISLDYVNSSILVK